MAQRTARVIMNGVTGRMGYRQHLVRSILAIREQGGVALADGTGSGPSRSWSAATRTSCAELAERHGLDRLDHRPGRRAGRRRRHDLLRRPGHPGAREADRCKAIAAGKHIYTEKPIAETVAEARSSWPPAAATPASRTASCTTSSTCPACVKLKRLIDGGFFGRILSVRGEFGYWVFEGDWQPAQRPSWNYRAEDGGGIVARHVPALELRAGEPVRPGHAGVPPRPPPTSPSAGDEQGKRLRRRPPTTPPTAIFELEGGVDRPDQLLLGRPGRPRRAGRVPGRRHPRLRGRRPARLPGPAPRGHPEAGLEPRPADHRGLPRPVAGGARQRGVRQRLQGPVGAVPAARRRRTRRTRTTSPPGAAGVQLAELGLRVVRARAAGSRSGAGADDALDTIALPRRTAAGARPRAREPRRLAPSARRAAATPDRLRGGPRGRRPAGRERARARPPPSTGTPPWRSGATCGPLRPRRRRGDGHRPARHGPGLGGHPRS